MKLDALVMAGGKGTRLRGKGEKPLLPFRGRPLIEWVLSALRGCRYVDRIFVITSPTTPETEARAVSLGFRTFRAPGAGYVEDFALALRELSLGKVLTVGSDLPFLTPRDLDWVVEEYLKRGKPSLRVVVPLSVLHREGLVPTLTLEGDVPAGVNIVDGGDPGGEEAVLVTERRSFAININTRTDLRKAEAYEEVKKHARQ
jgi:uncharacterized protein (TIGR00454 family)